LRGENQYFDGERDLELERLSFGVGAQGFTLVTYQHSFFKADGSPRIVGSLDVDRHGGSCKTYMDGNLGSIEFGRP
jgi:hypothetical protein